MTGVFIWEGGCMIRRMLKIAISRILLLLSLR